MKRLFVGFLALLLLTGCGAQTAETETTAPDTTPALTEATETEPVETEPAVIYAGQLADGVYEISVDSSASMFRVVKCVLTVENGAMTAAMTMSGQGYGMVYMGKGEEALADSEDAYIPFTEDENGGKVFTVPVEALNVEVNCAAWSIRKEKWYDRVLIFESADLPEEAFLAE